MKMFRMKERLLSACLRRKCRKNFPLAMLLSVYGGTISQPIISASIDIVEIYLDTFERLSKHFNQQGPDQMRTCVQHVDTILIPQFIIMVTILWSTTLFHGLLSLGNALYAAGGKNPDLKYREPKEGEADPQKTQRKKTMTIGIIFWKDRSD